MKRDEKEQQVSELREKFSKASAVILTDYRGLSVTEINGLRNQLRESNTEYRVAKNTLTKIALTDTEFAPLSEYLVGPNSIAFCYEEAQDAAKVFKDFTKATKKLEVKAGVIQGNLHTSEEIGRIADLPSRPEILAKMLGTLNAVPTSLVTVLSGVPRKFVQVLVAIKDQKENA